MTISIPVAQSLISTNVVDTTEVWNNEVFLPFIINGTEYQYDGEIFQCINTEPYKVKTYALADEDTYTVGQILWNDTDGQMQRVILGQVPQAPALYTPDLADGYDYTDSSWTGDERYTLLQDMPTGYTTGITHRPPSPTYGIMSFCFAGAGLHYYQLVTNDDGNTMRVDHYVLSTAYEVPDSTATPNNTHYISSLEAQDIFIPEDGSVITIVYIGNPSTIHTSVMTTAYTLGSYTDYHGWYDYSYPSWRAVTFNDDGTKCFVATQDGEIEEYTLTTAYETHSTTMSYTDKLSNNANADISDIIILDSIDFSRATGAEGEILYVLGGIAGYKRIWQLDLSTGYDLSTATLTGAKYKGTAYDAKKAFWREDGAGFYVLYAIYLLRYQAVSTWDIQEAVWDMNYWHTYIRTDDATYNIETILNDDYGNYKVVYYNKDWTLAGISASIPMNTYTLLDQDSIEDKAIIQTVSGENIFTAKTIIYDDTGLYARTHYDVDVVLTGSETTLSYAPVVSPSELPDFTLIGNTNDTQPFDGKNYTHAVAQNEMQYIISGTEKFNTIALGGVIAEHIFIEFKDDEGTVVATIDRDIDTARDTAGNLEPWYTTLTYYSVDDGNISNAVVMDENSSVEITLTSTDAQIELATLMLGITANAGFTNLTLKNDYKDFSIFEYDPWGNADYTERAKVSRYSGTVDIPITDYDMTDRLMTSLGKNLAIINGSDWASCSCDSFTIFSATQKIGRFMSFNQQTKIADNDMDEYATYSFTFEEIV